MNYRAFAVSSAWRSLGFWMAALMAVVQAIYALQAFVDPAGFAAYRGTPITGVAGTMWVHTYGSRTLFVALVIAVLLIRGELATLKWVALIGIVLPISDALVALRAEAPLAVVLRHVATGLYLLITFVVIRRSSDRARSREKVALTG